MGCCHETGGEVGCQYIDTVEFLSVARHYESGRSRILWAHLPPATYYGTDPLHEGYKITNWVDFIAANLPQIEYDPSPCLGTWSAQHYILGQHVEPRLLDIIEKQNITLTEAEKDDLGDCPLILFCAYYWTFNDDCAAPYPREKYTLTPDEYPIQPKVYALAVNRYNGKCVKVLWLVDMWGPGTKYKPIVPWTDVLCDEQCDLCDEHPEVQAYCDNCAECTDWLTECEDSDDLFPSGQRCIEWGSLSSRYLVTSNRSVASRCCFVAGPATRVVTGGPTSVGWPVQVRSVYTGELLTDATLPAGYDRTIPNWGSNFVVPAIPMWVYSAHDEHIIIGQLATGNQLFPGDDENEPIEAGPGSSVVTAWAIESITSPGNWVLQRTAPFIAYPGVPALGLTGLWVSGYVPRDPEDPESEDIYGVWNCNYFNLEDPPFIDQFEGMMGTGSLWCDKYYVLSNSLTAPVEGEEQTPFTSKRCLLFDTEAEPESILPGGYDEVGYWGWGYPGGYAFPGWWNNIDGVGLWGGWWGNGGGTGYNGFYDQWGWFAWWAYVIRDWTAGGDRDTVYEEFDPDLGITVTKVGCKDECLSTEDLPDDGCTQCDCDGDADFEIEIEESGAGYLITVLCSSNGPCGKVSSITVGCKEGECNLDLGPTTWQPTGHGCGVQFYADCTIPSEGSTLLIKIKDACGCEKVLCLSAEGCPCCSPFSRPGTVTTTITSVAAPPEMECDFCQPINGTYASTVYSSGPTGCVYDPDTSCFLLGELDCSPGNYMKLFVNPHLEVTGACSPPSGTITITSQVQVILFINDDPENCSGTPVAGALYEKVVTVDAEDLPAACAALGSGAHTLLSSSGCTWPETVDVEWN